jgi:hypothetical protein
MTDNKPIHNTGNIEHSWEDIETINRSMYAAADAEEWQEVVEFAASRHQRLLDHFQHFPVGPQYADFYHQRLSAMLNGERTLQTLARDARKRVMSEGTVVNKTHRAIGAYLA